MRTAAYVRLILTASFISFLLGIFGTLAILLVYTRSCKEVMVWQRADLREMGGKARKNGEWKEEKEKMKTELARDFCRTRTMRLCHEAGIQLHHW